MALAAEFNFSCADHKPENFDLVVNLGRPVLDSKGRDTGKVYVYAASYEEAGWFSAAGVKGQIMEMKASDLKGAANVVNYGKNMLSQITKSAETTVDKALSMEGVELRYTRDDLTGVRLEVNGAFHGVKHERFQLGEELKRLMGGFEGSDMLKQYKQYKETEDSLQGHADVIDHYKLFVADMNKQLVNSGIEVDTGFVNQGAKPSIVRP